MIIFQASPIRKWVGGTSSNTDWASLRVVLMSLYLADWGSSRYITYLSLSSLPSFITFYKYCLEIPTDFQTLTYTFPHYGCEFPGGQFFYVWNSSEFPSAFTWLVVLKIMLGPWDVSVCREDVEFCQPVKYVWVFFLSFFFFQELSYTLHPVWSSLNWIYILTELLTLFIIFYDLVFFKERCVEGTSGQKTYSLGNKKT